jgi:hypothetical protein
MTYSFNWGLIMNFIKKNLLSVCLVLSLGSPLTGTIKISDGKHLPENRPNANTIVQSCLWCGMDMQVKQENKGLFNPMHRDCVRQVIQKTGRCWAGAYDHMNGWQNDIKKAQDLLFMAVCDDCLFVVAVVLKHFPSLVNAQDASRDTPLHIAAKRCNLPMTKYLLNVRANMDIEDASGWCPAAVLCVSPDGTISIIP